MTEYRHYELNREELIVFYIATGILGTCISLLMYRSVMFALVIVPFVPRIRGYLCTYLNDRRKAVYMMQFKDFLFLAATSIGAGRSMMDAVKEAVPGIREIHGDKAILARELEAVQNRIDRSHEDDVTVLMDMAVLSGLEDVIDFVTVYQVCKQTGANLITAMNRASEMIIDKMTIEKEIREISRRKESEGLFIFAMPVLVIIMLNVSSPDYVAPLYETIAGRIIMTLVIAADVAIFGMIQKITRVDL